MKPTGRHSTYPCTHAYSSTPGGRVMGGRAGRGNGGLPWKEKAQPVEDEYVR